MSFLDKVPAYIKDVESENQSLSWQKRDFYGHQCDCEFCDRQDEGRDEEELDKIELTIKENVTMIKRLKAYSNLFNK